MAASPIPNQNSQSLQGPLFNYGGNRGSSHIPSPIPTQLAAQPIDRQVQICPLSLILDRLDDLHPAGCPHPTNLSNQPHPHFIAPGQASRVRAANFLELVG